MSHRVVGRVVSDVTQDPSAYRCQAVKEEKNILTLKRKAQRSYETSGVTRPMRQHHIPKDFDLQQHGCEKLMSEEDLCTVNRQEQ